MRNSEKLAVEEFLRWAIKNVPKLKKMEEATVEAQRVHQRISQILERINATLDVVQEEVPGWDSGG